MAAVPVLDADLKDFAGGFSSTPKSTGIDVQRLLVRGRGLPGMNPEGLVVARASLPADPKDETRVTANYEGRIGDIPVRADGSLTGKTVAAVLDVTETAPAAFAALAPGKIHLGAPLSAHAEVHGELPVLEPELRAHLGGGEITATGKVTLPEGDRVDMSATAQVNVKDLDVSLAETSAPPSRLTTMIEASIVSSPGGKIAGTYHVENQVGEVGGQVVPAARRARRAHGESVRGTAEVAEVGAPTNVQFSWRRARAARRRTSSISRPRRPSRISTGCRGSGRSRAVAPGCRSRAASISRRRSCRRAPTGTWAGST